MAFSRGLGDYGHTAAGHARPRNNHHQNDGTKRMITITTKNAALAGRSRPYARPAGENRQLIAQVVSLSRTNHSEKRTFHVTPLLGT
jgi:hypothetical protein